MTLGLRTLKPEDEEAILVALSARWFRAAISATAATVRLEGGNSRGSDLVSSSDLRPIHPRYRPQCNPMIVGPEELAALQASAPPHVQAVFRALRARPVLPVSALLDFPITDVS